MSRTLTLLLALSSLAQAVHAAPQQVEVFVSGQHGYHSFRIPAVIRAANGDLLAFCEGRKQSVSDTGDIDLVMKRSSDGGQTWGPLEVVFDDGPHAIGNPCPVVERTTGRIWLPMNRNLGTAHEPAIIQGTAPPREFWLTSSDDHGKTWAKPQNLSAQGRQENWGWLACGPGASIQLKSGRLLIPCNHTVVPNKQWISHALYSDDQGQTWKIGGDVGPNTNECQAVELADGSVMMNMRSYAGKNRRAVALSRDGGETWETPYLDETLIEPVCQASLIRYPLNDAGNRNSLIFANPASNRRDHFTIRLSDDDGKTWSRSKELHAGSAAYSSLVVLPDGAVGCLYERDDYRKITFAIIPFGWLSEKR